MIRYFKMKYNEIRIKSILYATITGFIDNQAEIMSFLQKTFQVLRDVPAEELRTEFIKQLAEIVHNENKEKDR